jgi:hypothetical protein
MAAVFRNEESSATAPKSLMLNVSAGKDVLRIDCSISKAIFHLSPPVQEGRAVTRKIKKYGK